MVLYEKTYVTDIVKNLFVLYSDQKHYFSQPSSISVTFRDLHGHSGHIVGQHADCHDGQHLPENC